MTNMSVRWFLVILILLTKNVSAMDLFNSTSSLLTPQLFSNKIEEFLNNSKSSRLSTACGLHLQEYKHSLLKKYWALSMFDAGGKLPSGILDGNVISLGNFDQCVEIESETDVGTINGKYCLGALIVAEKIPVLGLGTCLPASCSFEDINELYNHILGVPVTFLENTCHSKDHVPKLDGAANAALWFFGVLFGLMVISTAYDVFVQYSNKKPIHNVAIAFSVVSNGRKLFKINAPGQITCLYGIRSITMLWIIINHQYSRIPITPTVNTLDYVPILTSASYMFYHGNAPSVDSYLLMGGLVISYSFMNNQNRGGSFNLPLFYIHRYLRLTPPYAAVVLIIAALGPYFGSGPIYHVVMDSQINHCKDWWWSSLLYVQNFVNPQEICNLPSWYLSVDTQLYVIAPLFLFGMKKWAKATFITMGVLVLLMSIGAFLLTWIKEISAFWNINTLMGTNDIYLEQYYYMPHMRATPWLFGLFLGYVLSDMKNKRKQYKLNQIIVHICWAFSLCIMTALVFGSHDLIYGEYNRLENSIYAGFVRVSWSICISWIIFACVTGHGGVINWFLSLPIFEVGSRLVYSAYLIHYIVLAAVVANTKTNAHFNNLYQMHRFWGHTTLSFAIAVFLTLALEYPVPILEKVIFGRFEGKPTKKKDLNGERSNVN